MRFDRPFFSFFHLLSLMMIVTSFSPVFATETPKNLGTFKQWQAFTVDANDNPACYVMSEPIEQQGSVKDRGKTAALVTHFPEIGALDQVSLVLGFEPQAKNPVIAKIGGSTFKFTEVQGDRVWVKSRAEDRTLVQAMRKSNQMVVIAATSKGLRVQDTFSLSGFTKAYQAMSKACTR